MGGLIVLALDGQRPRTLRGTGRKWKRGCTGASRVNVPVMPECCAGRTKRLLVRLGILRYTAYFRVVARYTSWRRDSNYGDGKGERCSMRRQNSRMPTPNKPLSLARSEFSDRRWAAAANGFETAAKASMLGPEDADRLAWSLVWSGAHPNVCLDAFERLESACRLSGDERRAARAALEQARLHALVGNEHVSAACWSRALEHLGENRNCAEHGLAQALAGYARLLSGDVDAAAKLARISLETCRQARDRTVEAMGQYLLGQTEMLSGNVASGLKLFDRSMSAVTAGEVQPSYGGLIYCGLLWACRQIGDWSRASEWYEIARRWCEREAVADLPPHLDVHRAELLRVQGRLFEAEQTALAALDRAGAWGAGLIGWAYHQIGESRLCLGDLDGAQTAFVQANEAGYDPEPGRSNLLLVEGKSEAALRAIVQAIDQKRWYSLSSQVYTLPAGVSIAIKTGHAALAADWCDRLDTLARQYNTLGVSASAHVARGEFALAEGRTEDAISLLTTGMENSRRSGAPYDAARARVLLGCALSADGDVEGAQREWVEARRFFEQAGTKLDWSRAERLLVESGYGEPGNPQDDLKRTLTRRQRDVAQFVAQGFSNREIAQQLSISPLTAETHVRNILMKLDVSSRTQIAILVHKSSLESEPG